MAGALLLGIYNDVDEAAEAIQGIRLLGIPENRIDVLSATPLRYDILGRTRPRSRVILGTLIGALTGFVTALILVGGTQVLYPIRQGGQPLWPIPPQLIILFEVTMLGTMFGTFIAFFLTNQFPRFGRPASDPRIMAGRVGVAVESDDARADRACEALEDAGAVEVVREPGRRQVDQASWWLWLLTVVLILGVLGVAGGLVAYDILRLPWFAQMIDSPVVAYEQGPRLQAPAEAAPVQGPVLIDDQPATQPVKADPASLQRGQVLYGMHCALCHNPTGDGNGPVSGFFVAGMPKPFDLTSSQVQSLTDQQIFVAITNGFGTMPSLREDLTPSQRWDVVNWVRALKK